MAKRVITQMTAAIDPSMAADATVRFSVEGASYEIDLSKKNADAFGSALAPYIGAARRTGGRRSSFRSSGGFSTSRRSDSSAVRAWATEQGIEINSRGRIPADVQAKYDAAQ